MRGEQLEFAVIAGSLKGRMISSPDLGVTRPPLARVRRAIFDYLNPHLDGSKYLDLFSGTGSYLFEAVSRGAVLALGIEIESELSDSINYHASRFGIADRLSCKRADVFEELPKLCRSGRLFDIAMIAPPQYEKLVTRSLQALATNPVLTSSGLMLCQHDTAETDSIDFSPFQIVQQRKYGNTSFTVLSGRTDSSTAV